MFNPHKIMANPFKLIQVGIDKLVAFVADHLPKMASNNTNGFLTARIAATTTAFAALNSAYQDDQGSLGSREVATQMKAAYRATVTSAIGKIYVALQNKYGENAPELSGFFPNGRTAFNRGTDDQMSNNLSELVTALTAKQSDVGQQVVTDATALRDGWTTVYAPSKTAGGGKDTSMNAKNAALAALELELFKNVLTIALQYPDQPQMLDVYMQTSLLQVNTSSSTPAPPSPTPTPTPVTLTIAGKVLSWTFVGTAPAFWAVTGFKPGNTNPANSAQAIWQNGDDGINPVAGTILTVDASSLSGDTAYVYACDAQGNPLQLFSNGVQVPAAAK